MTRPRPLVIYDAECPLCVRARDWTRARSPENALEWLPCQSPERESRAPTVTEADCQAAMQFIDDQGAVHAGAAALRQLLPRMNAPWRWLAPLFALPGAPRAYAFTARRRRKLSALLGWESCDIEGRCTHGPFGK